MSFNRKMRKFVKCIHIYMHCTPHRVQNTSLPKTNTYRLQKTREKLTIILLIWRNLNQELSGLHSTQSMHE